MKNPSLVAAFSLLLLAAACQPTNPPAEQLAATDQADVTKAIAASNGQYFQAFAKGDSTLLFDCYTPDACVMPPNAPALCGQPGLGAFYRLAYQQLGIRNGTLTTQQVWVGGSYATEQGTYELRNAQDQSLDKGKYLVIWKKTPGGWKMLRDMFSSVSPPPAPTAVK